jgi:uncharacterized protein YceH (UPF0502 family)
VSDTAGVAPDEPAGDDGPSRPVLDAVEARILGALVEKQATTPEAYPLTVNALQLACNQKNNREPVGAFEAGELGHALRNMEARGWVRSVHGARAQRWEHRFAQAFSLTLRQQALLSLLLMRGPQTLSELASRSERIADFDGLDAVRDTLERLEQRRPALAVRLGRAAGQREDRYMHLLGGPVDGLLATHARGTGHGDPDDGGDHADGRADDRAHDRGVHADTPSRGTALAALEARVTALEAELRRLRASLGETD